MEQAISASGKSKSTLTNYSRQLAHLALHFNSLPAEPDSEQVLDYLYLVKSKGSRSATFFKFTVYGMRYACKMRGLSYQQFNLPEIQHDSKLPVVLSQPEVRALLKACTLLKHSILLVPPTAAVCAVPRCVSSASPMWISPAACCKSKTAKAVKIDIFPWVPCFAAASPNISRSSAQTNGSLKVRMVPASSSAALSGW